jgi:hypothetical protein
MKRRPAITVNRPREVVERVDHRHLDGTGAEVSFSDAPGDRGTEVHAEVEVPRVTGPGKLAEVRDELRRFKRRVETATP